MSAIRNVVFDFGGVLVEWQPSRLLASQFPVERERDIARRDILGHPDWIELDRGALLEVDAIPRFAARTGFGDARIRGFFDAVRLELQPRHDTIRIVQQLAGRGVPLYGLSNMSAEIFDWLRERHAFFALFNAIVVSGRVGMAKPEPGIYAHLARTHGLDPRESLFVDDMPANVEAAREVGFDSVQFTDAADLLAELARRGL